MNVVRLVDLDLPQTFKPSRFAGVLWPDCNGHSESGRIRFSQPLAELRPDLIRTATFTLCAAPKGIGPYIRQHFLDTTFRGLYHANAFDLALLIPYFIVLILLAGYGVHRYVLVYLYYKHRKNHTTEPAAHFAELPRVTVQLPIFNEQYVVERLLEAICRLEYPREKLDIQVLDDSTDETDAVARGLVERYAALRQSHHLPPPHQSRRLQGGRAGRGDEDGEGRIHRHLRRRLHSAGRFSAAHHPPLHRPQDRHGADALDAHQSPLFLPDRGRGDPARRPLCAGALGRARTGLFFNFNGTAGMWRRTAIEEAGGWQHDTLTEDTDLSYRAQLKGWKFVYLQDVECPRSCRWR